jgi:hypothetical protein
MDNKCQGGSQRGWRTEGEGRATASSQIGLRLIAAGKIFFLEFSLVEIFSFFHLLAFGFSLPPKLQPTSLALLHKLPA